MKIGIEAQRLFRYKKHGMEIVTLELIKEIQNLDKENQYVVFVKDDVDDTCINETENFKIRKLKKSPYPIWEQFLLPKAAEEENLDVLHCTSNTAPLFLKIPLILTLHDIIYLESLNFKGSIYQNFGNIYRRLVVPYALKKSKIVITVSEFERKRIVDQTQIEGRKIKSIYNAKSKSFTIVDDQNRMLAVQKRYNLPDKFILFFGNTAPKKNTRRVIEGYTMYANSSSNILPLVITDCKESYIHSILSDMNQALLTNNIIVKDYISFKDLPEVYNLAELFLYPSLRESFGLPIIESMACGTPVITSNASSMPEVAGNAAILINPINSKEIGNAIKILLSDRAYYKSIVKMGIERASHFDWKVSAKKVIKIYHETKLNIN